MLLSILKVLIALISPIVPIDIKSSKLLIFVSYRLATYTTKRKLCSIKIFLASTSPSLHKEIYFSSSSLVRGASKFSFPAIYKVES